MPEPNTPPDLPAWIITGIVSIVGTLAGAIALLFRINVTRMEKQLAETQEHHTQEIRELKEDRDELKTEAIACRQDREDLRVKVASLEAMMQQHERRLNDGDT